MNDLHLLPKVRDSWSYLYVEHKKVDQEDKAIALHDKSGKIAVPCASLTALLLGPGTSITHAAVKVLADSGCLVMWTGEGAVRFYAQGLGETRSARNLLHQARLVSTPELRLQVVRRLYEMRFTEPLDASLTLQQIRGREGIRVREAYAKASRETGVSWSGRSYRRDSWHSADPDQPCSVGGQQLPLWSLSCSDCRRWLLSGARLHPYRQDAFVRLRYC
jgi:CRISPR-associated protein Cas1